MTLITLTAFQTVFMQNIELSAFMARHLAAIDYSLRERRQTYLLTGLSDPLIDKRLEHAAEEVEIARLGMLG